MAYHALFVCFLYIRRLLGRRRTLRSNHLYDFFCHPHVRLKTNTMVKQTVNQHIKMFQNTKIRFIIETEREPKI